MSYYNDNMYENAYSKYTLHQYDQALEDLDQIDDPHHVDATYLYGCIFLKKKNLPIAKEKLIRCTNLDSSKLEPYLRLIDIYIQENNFGAAKEYLDKVLNRLLSV